jgi:hypothetical protein
MDASPKIIAVFAPSARMNFPTHRAAHWPISLNLRKSNLQIAFLAGMIGGREKNSRAERFRAFAFSNRL